MLWPVTRTSSVWVRIAPYPKLVAKNETAIFANKYITIPNWREDIHYSLCQVGTLKALCEFHTHLFWRFSSHHSYLHACPVGKNYFHPH